ncbi:hypothetical protein PENTCL1PPCAC_7168, partial [Pristionchus entomophagus]
FQSHPDRYTMDITALSNEELRNALVEHGQDVGPVGPSTRKVYEKKLIKLLAGGVGDTSLLLNDSCASSIPDEPSVRRTPSPTKGRKTPAAAAASAVRQEERGAASSDEERGDESMRYLDEEEEEEYRRKLSPTPVFADGKVETEKKNGGVGTVGLVVSLVLVLLFTFFLLMRSLEIETDGANHEEL